MGLKLWPRPGALAGFLPCAFSLGEVSCDRTDNVHGVYGRYYHLGPRVETALAPYGTAQGMWHHVAVVPCSNGSLTGFGIRRAGQGTSLRLLLR